MERKLKRKLDLDEEKHRQCLEETREIELLCIDLINAAIALDKIDYSVLSDFLIQAQQRLLIKKVLQEDQNLLDFYDEYNRMDSPGIKQRLLFILLDIYRKDPGTIVSLCKRFNEERAYNRGVFLRISYGGELVETLLILRFFLGI